MDLDSATLTVRNVGELVATLQALHGKASGPLWFRGHRCAQWQLRPTVHRAQGLREADLASQFVLEAPARHSAIPALDDLSAWLTLMRHYGLPSRLLDWTDSPLVAAYFAVAYEQGEGDRAIWALRPVELNELHGVQGIPFLTHDAVRSLVEHAFGRGHGGGMTLAVRAAQMDLRMALQAARYTIHGSTDALDESADASSFLSQLVIPGEAVDQFKADLSLLGIRRSVLFPDLEHLAKELQEGQP